MLKIDVNKAYNHKRRKISISCKAEILAGKTTAIYGKSGIGKTTVLRMISGLEKPDSGTLQFGNNIWFNAKINKPIADRQIGMVFQEDNLFPNMTVEENLKYASGGKVEASIYHYLKMVGFDGIRTSYPSELSGGEKRYVSVVRSLCQKPKIVLLDEPFAGIDDDTIDFLIMSLKRLQKEVALTILMVTHRKSILEAMADEVIHMLTSESQVQGTPNTIFKA